MKLKLVTTAGAFLLGSVAAMAQPNVLLIIADDMGLDASKCYDVGNQQASMPNIEAMCAQGLVFMSAYAMPTCSPTRATIMSGQYGFRTGVGAPIASDGSDDLDPDTPTLFDALRGEGYASNVLGKWHISGRDLGFEMPTEMGVSNYFGLYNGGIQDYFNWPAIENGQEVMVEGYSTTVLTDKAIDWINGQDQPWFLWLAYNAPHSPFHLPPNNLHSSDDLPADEESVNANPLPYYNAMLEALDTEIGRLLASMSDDERANTYIMFIGDNGTPNQVIGDLYGTHQAKGTLYNSATNVPFVITGPGVLQGRTDAFVNTTDFYSTITAIAGASASSPDSIDFSPVLSGGEGARTFINVDHFTNRETRGGGQYGWAWRETDYKLIAPKGEELQLYSLIDDPLEQNNLLANGGTPEAIAMANEMKAKRDALVASK